MLQTLRKLQQDSGTPGDQYAAEATWSNLFHHHPLQHHHSSYRYMLSKQQRQRGISHFGSAERLRVALSRAITNKKLTVAVVGGSISAGTGAEDAPAWVDRLETYLKETYGKVANVNVTVNNGAVPGTTSAYMSGCVNLHVPADADIVVVEYTVNDDQLALPAMDNPVRRPYERLLRKLLSMPTSPAVVLLHAYAWFRPEPTFGVFYSNSERDLNELAGYYGLPVVSVKGCCFQAMQQGVPGFQVHAVRRQDLLDSKGLAFYYDEIHPDGNTGHRVMAELVVTLLQRGVADLLHSPLTEADKAAAAQPLPPPMIPGNWESLSDRCFVGEAFKTKAVIGQPASWDWVNESRSLRPKWGYVSTEPGASLQLLLNTTASSGAAQHPVLVQVAYLSSYEHMGKAAVKCVSGCSCDESEINGYHVDHNSLLKLHRIYVSQHEECVMAVQVKDETDAPDGEHKVKLAAAVVSEEAGEQHADFDNAAAVEHVHDISFRHVGFGHSGVFDIRNHI